ncbi:MAG: hypothetical protein DWI22_18665 [Planctomycetota bacterium]|nr:MAG: hypothetical protein DWI22_18665 [Planctomycetota bacterium]
MILDEISARRTDQFDSRNCLNRPRKQTRIRNAETRQMTSNLPLTGCYIGAPPHSESTLSAESLKSASCMVAGRPKAGGAASAF